MKLQTRQLRQLEPRVSERRIWARAAEKRILRKARETPSAPCVKRVLQILQLMRKAETLRLQLFEQCMELRNDPRSFVKHEEELGKCNFTSPSLRGLQALNLEYQESLRTIEMVGKRYHWSPTVRGGDFLGLVKMFTWNKRTEDEAWENWAIFWLLDHVESSGLSPSRILRFRNCRECSQWFYALTDHQLHCSSACRQKFHANSPEFRAKRAKYMRERYRPQEKERELKAKPVARRKK